VTPQSPLDLVEGGQYVKLKPSFKSSTMIQMQRHTLWHGPSYCILFITNGKEIFPLRKQNWLVPNGYTPNTFVSLRSLSA